MFFCSLGDSPHAGSPDSEAATGKANSDWPTGKAKTAWLARHSNQDVNAQKAKPFQPCNWKGFLFAKQDLP
jgi:hypothetical protein